MLGLGHGEHLFLHNTECFNCFFYNIFPQKCAIKNSNIHKVREV